jgi:hypothetical protein
MERFINKEEVFEYIKKRFIKESRLILVRGSTATKPAKKFSDFDIEIWGNKLKKPYYEIALLKEKPILITAYYYKYKEGEEIQKTRDVKVLFGVYNKEIEKIFNSPEHFAKDKYTPEEKIKRECQLLVDFFFKYLRSGDKDYLNSVQKRI